MTGAFVLTGYALIVLVKGYCICVITFWTPLSNMQTLSVTIGVDDS